ncbi:MAG TPA: glycosyltransferase family 39 protein [Patescibacteria group bacterium]
METLKKKLAAHGWEVICLLVIIAVGVFLRTYNWAPWLHFEVDQTWDFKIVSKAVTEGINNLPLLGPTAGGGRALRLGPSFYYLEYLSALIFGNTPTGHAANVLIFSILTLPLFYLFARKYFSKQISLGLLTITATSFYLVTYSRFSWSPDVLPFFILLSFYALLRSVNKSEKHPVRWLLVAAAATAITTQIHFNAFFVIPAIIVVFLIYKRPHFSFKTWAAVFAIILVIYSPMILSEIKTHGEDTLFFLEKISKPTDHKKPFLEKTAINIQYDVFEYFLILSGNDQVNYRIPNGGSLGLTCSKNCGSENSIPLRILAFAIFLASLIILVHNTIKEKDPRRKDFLIIILAWFIFSVLYFFKIFDSNILFPRFFLVVSPLVIVMFGLILEKLRPEKNKLGLVIMAAIVAALAYANISRAQNYFHQLKDVGNKQESIKLKDVFPYSQRATLELQKKVVDYVAAKARENGYPVYIQCAHEYAPAYWYLLNSKGIHENFSLTSGSAPAQANYVYIAINSQTKQKDAQDEMKGFSLSDSHSFGSITVYTFSPLPDAKIPQISTNSLQYISTQTQQISNIMTWNKLFKHASKESVSESEDSQTDNAQSIGE